MIQGKDARAFPVFPEFLNPPRPILRFSFAPVIEPLMRTYDTEEAVWPSSHDFYQALEIAIALLIRMAYLRGGFNQTMEPAQKRFVDPNVDLVLSDVDALRQKFAGNSLVVIALAAHSI